MYVLYYIIYKYANGHAQCFNDKRSWSGRGGAAAVSISGRGIEERKNRITDEYVTGILALGKNSHSPHALVVKVRIGGGKKNVAKSNFSKLLFFGVRGGARSSLLN